MNHEGGDNTTQMLRAIAGGDRVGAERLMAVVYDELRALAGSYFKNEARDHTLQPTALVHEAFFRLVNGTQVELNDRAHFFALAATAMRRILADHARRRKAAKRGGDWQRVNLDAGVPLPTSDPLDVIALDNVLARLAALDDRKHRVVEMRFFAGLTVDEVATVLNVSKTTVESEWRAARAWLRAELEQESGT